jgi:hypothetical protein
MKYFFQMKRATDLTTLSNLKLQLFIIKFYLKYERQ